MFLSVNAYSNFLNKECVDESAKNKLHFQMFSKSGPRYGKSTGFFFNPYHSNINEFFTHLLMYLVLIIHSSSKQIMIL